MAVTVVLHPREMRHGPEMRIRSAHLYFSGSYASPGETVAAADLGLTAIYNVQATNSVIAYWPTIAPVTPDADGSHASFVVGWVDGSTADEDAVIELDDATYPEAILGGVVQILVYGR